MRENAALFLFLLALILAGAGEWRLLSYLAAVGAVVAVEAVAADPGDGP